MGTIAIIGSPYEVELLRRIVVKLEPSTVTSKTAEALKDAYPEIDLTSVVVAARGDASGVRQTVDDVRAVFGSCMPLLLIASLPRGEFDSENVVAEWGVDHLLWRPVEEEMVVAGVKALIAGESINDAPDGEITHVPSEEVRALRDRVHEKYNHVLVGDYFKILDIDRTATPDAIDDAFLRLLAEFDESRHESLVEPYRSQAQQIRVTLLEAQYVLSNPVLRESYRENL